MWTNDSLRRPGNSAYLTPMGNLVWAHRPANFKAIPFGRAEAVLSSKADLGTMPFSGITP